MDGMPPLWLDPSAQLTAVWLLAVLLMMPAYYKTLQYEPKLGRRLRTIYNLGLLGAMVAVYLTIALVSPYGPPRLWTLLIVMLLIGGNFLAEMMGWIPQENTGETKEQTG